MRAPAALGVLTLALCLPACGDKGEKPEPDHIEVTPLILAWEGDPLAFLPAEPNAEPFAIDPDEACLYNDWPAPETPWLVRDLDGNGQIDDGSELFGSGTVLSDGTRAAHGFEALAELDADGDGQVSGADPAYAELALWSDWDLDHSTDPGELTSLRDAGVHAIYLGYRAGLECDDRGNCGIERSRFVQVDETGRHRGHVIDVYLPCRGL